jgi:hypothetical protein
MKNSLLRACIDYLLYLVNYEGECIREWHTTDYNLIYVDKNYKRRVVRLSSVERAGANLK